MSEENLTDKTILGISIIFGFIGYAGVSGKSTGSGAIFVGAAITLGFIIFLAVLRFFLNYLEEKEVF